MTKDLHDEARRFIASGGGEELSTDERHRLNSHLAECAACRNFQESASQLVSALRSVSVTADARLVRATQMRVRFHAERLRETRERMWLVSAACVGVGICAALTAPLLWRLFAWLAERTGISGPVWQTAFLFFYAAPALTAAVLLLARGTHFSSGPDHSTNDN